MSGDDADPRGRFEESYWRASTVTREGRGFADTFYDRFLEASEEARTLFSNTDFPAQKRMFVLSILYVSSAYDTFRSAAVLDQLARRHRSIGVSPGLFDVWTDCLLQTVRDYDPEWDESVEEAWRAVMAPGIGHLRKACAS